MDPIEFFAWIGHHGTGVFTFFLVLAIVTVVADVSSIVLRAVERRRNRGVR